MIITEQEAVKRIKEMCREYAHLAVHFGGHRNTDLHFMQPAYEFDRDALIVLMKKAGIEYDPPTPQPPR